MTGILYVAVIVGAVLAGGWWFWGLTMLFGLLGLNEFIRITNKNFVSNTTRLLDLAGAALLLTAALVLCVGLTFGATWLLSVTVLRGKPSAFALELPPYRAPQVGQVLVRSVFDRTLFVLGRAAAVAAPAGMVLWALANAHPGGVSLLTRCAAALDPLGQVMGMDGVLLLAFVLGFPANEIVLPIAVMGYLAQGSLSDALGLAQMHALLTANGWTWTTAVSAVLFFLLHWPCSTTLWTIRRETGSAKWTLLAALLPTALGMALCAAFTALTRLIGL